MNPRAVILPLALFALLAAALVLANPAQLLASGAPPAEEIAFERVEMQPGVIKLHVRNAVSAPVTVAQVLVDDAYWQFEMEPETTLGRYAAGTVTVNYPWVEAETHVVTLLTSTGIAWEHEIAVATTTPEPDAAAFGKYALIGLLVGTLPILAGVALYPILREGGAMWRNVLLAFTLGLLGFLAVDTLEEGLELARETPGAFQGLAVLAGAALLAMVGVLALESWLQRRGAQEFTLAVLIALGIGLHNLGEGLAVGTAFALGSLALGSALIIGFALHNVTEGPAILAPLLRRDAADSMRRGPRFASLVGLAALAGLPTIGGAWLGAFTTGILLPVVFFGLGVGAILVVLVQVGRVLRKDGGDLLAPRHLLAFAAGYVVMLATAFLTSA